MLASGGEDGEFRLIRGYAGLARGTRVLLMVPLAPFRDGSESLAEVFERIYAG